MFGGGSRHEFLFEDGQKGIKEGGKNSTPNPWILNLIWVYHPLVGSPMHLQVSEGYSFHPVTAILVKSYSKNFIQ